VANVFISHSSHDKVFVRKLASGLLAEGFPVWLDSWELDLGDSLLDKIYDGIDTSSVVLLVISRTALESGWVNRELNAAITKEQQIGRKFLIPIKIDDCEPPLKVADRLYADFSLSFSASLSKLIETLTKLGCRNLATSPDRELISLSFTRVADLELASFERTIAHIRKRHGAVIPAATQIVVNNDREYEELLHRLHHRIDNVASDPFYSAGLEYSLRGTLDLVRRNELYLSQGVGLMIVNECHSQSISWFCRLLRGRSVYNLWAAQMPDATALAYGQAWDCAGLASDTAAQAFFGVESVKPIVIWPRKEQHHSFSMFIDGEEVARLFDEGVYSGPDSLVITSSYAALIKYVYPQMVAQHLIHGEPEILWNLENAMVGIR
jgi:TIR domain